jgi:hypothetical protein
MGIDSTWPAQENLKRELESTSRDFWAPVDSRRPQAPLTKFPTEQASNKQRKTPTSATRHIHTIASSKLLEKQRRIFSFLLIYSLLI